MPSLSGDDGRGDPLVPIPNTIVKPSSADGTWGENPWESRTLPGKTNPSNSWMGFLYESQKVDAPKGTSSTFWGIFFKI